MSALVTLAFTRTAAAQAARRLQRWHIKQPARLRCLDVSSLTSGRLHASRPLHVGTHAAAAVCEMVYNQEDEDEDGGEEKQSIC